MDLKQSYGADISSSFITSWNTVFQYLESLISDFIDLANADFLMLTKTRDSLR